MHYKKELFRRILSSGMLLFVALLIPAVLQAQSRISLSGVVRDTDNQPLAGVFVSETGTSSSTVTDAEGRFTLAVSPSAKSLSFSLLGMRDVVVAVNGQSYFEVQMQDDREMLAETVVVGYGTMIRKELSSSVASVSNAALNERATSFNALQGMAGKLAGVSISSTSGRPGGNAFVRVRGKGSINASSDPLFVMDGVVDVDPTMINNADIERIDVLKDAAATAMYGAKGANGVVIITTKQGQKGQGTITFDNTFGMGWVTRFPARLTSEEYLQYLRDAFAYSGNTMSYFTEPYEKLFTYATDASGNYLRDDDGLLIPTPKYQTNWSKEFYRPTMIQDYNVSFSKADEKSSLYAALGYKDMDGIIKYSGSKRLSGKINAATWINDWLDVRFQASVSRQAINSVDGENESGLGYSVMRYLLEIPVIVPVVYEDGTYGKAGDHLLGGNMDAIQNIIEKIKRNSYQDYAVFNAQAGIHFTPNLTLTVQGDYQITNTESDYSAEAGIIGVTETNGGEASITKSSIRRMSNEDYLTYENRFFDGRLKSTFVGGFSAYYYEYNTSFSGSSNYFDSSFQHYNLGVGTVYTQPSSNYDKRTMASFYFRTNHNWDGKYLLGLTFRADGASNLGNNSKWGFFPSASAAWVISEEPWFEPARQTVNHMKLRLSFGQVGNSSLASYKTFSQYQTGKTILGNQQVSNVTLANLGNQDLRWETSTQLDAGMDISLFQDRIQIITDAYIRNTTGLLFNMQVPITTGYATSATNLGKLSNRGFELTIHSHNINHGDFLWDTDFIFSDNRTFCVDLNGEKINPGSGQFSIEGKEWGVWKAYQRLGVWQLDEVEEAIKYGYKPGNPKYADINGDGKYTEEDMIDIGRAVPRYEFSLVNTFYWKGFSLLVDLGAKTGFWVAANDDYEYGISNQASKLVLAAWRPDNQATVSPVATGTGDFYGILSDDYRMHKGDFLRIRNIGLSYDFKRDLLKNSRFIKGLSFGANAENVYVWTTVPSIDPEVAGLNINDGFFGWTSPNNYPKPLVITGNLKITF